MNTVPIEKSLAGFPVSNGNASSGLRPYSFNSWWSRPRAADRPGLQWHVASRAFAAGMWSVPRRYRFKIARRFTAVLTPLIKRTAWYRLHSPLGIDGVEEIALHHVLNIMSGSGALFDLDMKIEGAEIVRAALRKSHGTLIVAPHALLVLSLFRYLCDLGFPPTIVSAAPFVHVYGTRLIAPALQPSSSLLIQVRSALRRGEVVCAMIDEGPRNSARTVLFETCSGPVYISDALLKLAIRCKAEVIFTSARLDNRNDIILTFEAPQAPAAMSELSIAKSFVNFLETHVERRGRGVSK